MSAAPPPATAPAVPAGAPPPATTVNTMVEAAASDKATKKAAKKASKANGNKAKDDDDDDEPLATDVSGDGAADDDIHAKLRALRRDEVVGLSQSSTNRHTVDTANNYKALIFLETGRYFRYLYQTWMGIFVTTIFGGLGLFDWFSIFFFAFGGTILLGVVLVFCLAIHFPMLVRLYYKWADKYGGGLGLVNSGNPNLFHALTIEQATAAKEHLSSNIRESKDNDYQRFFNYDAAKLLLQLASVVYEHENDAIRAAVTITKDQKPKTEQPTTSGASSELSDHLTGEAHKVGALVSDLYTASTASQVDAALDSTSDAKIRDFCKRFNMDFEPVSELNNTASAFAGLFWDPSSNWIVVAFKGTAPVEFGEWLSDFNTKMVDCGAHIDNFKRVHKGFKDRVFPDEVSALGNVRPYDTISLGVKTLAKWLYKRSDIAKERGINVWITGHSLGCATATLVYSRFLMRHKDMGKHSTLRDAYIFAAPIICDRDTVSEFNNKMMADKKRPKTMWRVTSNGDVVATCLPELGDYTNIPVSRNNAFAFAHLGLEINMKDYPSLSYVAGNHIARGAQVQIESKFTIDEIKTQRALHMSKIGEQKRVAIGTLLQRIPIVGRVAAHATINYWDQLDRVAIGKTQWSAIG